MVRVPHVDLIIVYEFNMSSVWFRQWKRKVSFHKPLMLKVETINVCNAKCCFCAYSKSKRPKSVLAMELYGKVLEGYNRIGGGPLTLTPVVGDVLLDPYLLDRLKKLSSFPAITDVSFTTNLIAHEKLSDGEWSEVLRRIHYLQVSLGGYDAATYKEMFGVDAFNTVWEGLHRLASIKKENGYRTRLTVALRAPNVSGLLEHENTNLLRNIGYNHISGISVFNNWGGDVTADDLPPKTEISTPNQKEDCCIMPAMFMAVLSNGKVTGCSCVDHEGLLEIGDLYKNSLNEIWQGATRKALCRSFEGGSKDKICINCCSYSSLRLISKLPLWNGATLAHLPTAFYDNFAGG